MNENFDLMTTVEYGGCSAKLPAAELEKLLSDLPVLDDIRLLVGSDTGDDASVWKVSDEVAVISTTDFFPPLCSDPYEFGQIAAANSLSDIYAMGGTAVTALNLVMFPSKKIPLTILHEILRGGADKCIEAGVVLAGGHTIDDYPPKFGLAVTGTVHPQRIITNSAASPGDLLILTKALGTGILTAGRRIGEASETDFQTALDSMKVLNRRAAEIMQDFNIRCATDITGFSLLGHGLKMARESGVSLTINSTALPVLPGAYELLDYGCIPGAAFRNLSYVEKAVNFDSSIDYNLKMLTADAQTSGGILLCAPKENAAEMLEQLTAFYPAAVVIGQVAPESADGIYVTLS